MTVTVNWDDDTTKRIIRFDFVGLWTWQDYVKSVGISDALIASQNHVVDIIGDFSESKALPPNAFQHVKRAMVSAPSNWGVLVICGNNRVVNTMVTLFRQINREFGDRLYVAANREASHTLVARLQDERELQLVVE